MIKTTPKTSKKIEFKEYITGSDFEHIQEPKTDIKFTINESGKPSSGQLDAGKASTESLHRAIQRVVLSVEDVKEDILKSVLDLPVEDYHFIVNWVNKIVSGENFETPILKPEGGTD